MLVKDWMTKEVITVNVNNSMYDAVKRIKENNIHRLPVMKNGNLVGIVTDRDLKRASASEATSLDIHELLYLLSKITIEEIMTKDPIAMKRKIAKNWLNSLRVSCQSVMSRKLSDRASVIPFKSNVNVFGDNMLTCA